jgi:hypothetical protein
MERKQKIYKYSLDGSGFEGFVYAFTEKEAGQKVKLTYMQNGYPVSELKKVIITDTKQTI